MTVTFEGYERRADKINKCLADNGIASLEEALQICTDKGFNPREIVNNTQSIAFQNAEWAYTLGCALAVKRGAKSASEAAAIIGEGIQAFTVPGSVAEDRKVVIPGFYGVMPDGHIRTFSRGGSDITGALAAAALGADVYENWTDVSGILMADPRIVDDPEPIRRVTYSELRELSYIGAQVLHEGTIFPVREKNIPLNIRNTNAPDHPGTMILESIGDEMEEGGFITGIAGKKGFSIITIAKTGMSSEPGSLLKILNVLAKHEVNVEYLPSGIDNVSLVVSSDKVSRSLYEMLGELQKEVQPNKITVTEHIAIVAAVGRKMAYRPGVSGKIFAKLGENGVNIRMITQGPEELNIIVGVEEKDFEQAIRVLYNSFVKENVV